LRKLVDIPPIYDQIPNFSSVQPEMKMDFSRMIGKPFHLTTFSWSNQSAGTDFANLGFPSSVINLNKLASAPFDLASLYHAKACFIIQVAGTPMHSGALIASITPCDMLVSNLNIPYTIHTIQSAPHAYLLANSSSAICLEIPWYSTTKLRHTPSANDNMDEYSLQPFSLTTPSGANSDYASLNFHVVSPLGVPNTALTSVQITVAVMFKELDFYIPKAPFVSQANETISTCKICQLLMSNLRDLCVTLQNF